MNKNSPKFSKKLMLKYPKIHKNALITIPSTKIRNSNSTRGRHSDPSDIEVWVIFRPRFLNKTNMSDKRIFLINYNTNLYNFQLFYNLKLSGNHFHVSTISKSKKALKSALELLSLQRVELYVFQ